MTAVAKNSIRWVLPLLVVIGLTACASGDAATTPPIAFTNAPASTEAVPPDASSASSSLDALIESLRASGLEVAMVGEASGGLFDRIPTLVTANGRTIEVYQFESVEALSAAAGSVPLLLATTRWAAPPHIYQGDQIIAVYVGDDAGVVAGLGSALGAEIAASVPDESPGASEIVDSANLYFIARDDGGVSGDLVGCSDSIIGIQQPIDSTAPPIDAALSSLLALHEEMVGQTGLYNALHLSDLGLESVTQEAGLVTVYLSGQLALAGECDTLRARAQIEYTVLQFPGVEAVQTFINNIPLQDFLSPSG